MRKRLCGSVAIEAVLVVSIIMILLIALFGTLLSIYLEEESHWIALQATEEMGILAMPFMGHERIVMEGVNTLILSKLTVDALNRQIDVHHLSTHLRVHPDTNVKFSAFGFAELSFKVKFMMPSVDQEKTIILPMSASVVSDGLDFSDNLVFITTYGEKYHKDSCYHLRKSKFGISLTSAKDKGYEACKTCHDRKKEIGGIFR